jgi:hypothetical protein
MSRRLERIAGVAGVSAALALGTVGCVVYEPPPGAYAPAPAQASAFDRAWAAAVGAFADQGVQIVQQDRAAGTISGTAGDIVATGQVRQLADGRVQVEFGVGGNVAANPALKDRIVGSYNRRMGR